MEFESETAAREPIEKENVGIKAVNLLENLFVWIPGLYGGAIVIINSWISQKLKPFIKNLNKTWNNFFNILLTFIINMLTFIINVRLLLNSKNKY